MTKLGASTVGRLQSPQGCETDLFSQVLEDSDVEFEQPVGDLLHQLGDFEPAVATSGWLFAGAMATPPSA